MSKVKINCMVSVFLLTVLSGGVTAENWEPHELSKEWMLEKCAIWYDAIARQDFEVLASFYPPELVLKHSETLKKSFNYDYKKYNKRLSRPDYVEKQPTTKIGEKYSSVNIAWSSRKGKTNGGYSCIFTKQKNNLWRFGENVY